MNRRVPKLFVKEGMIRSIALFKQPVFLAFTILAHALLVVGVVLFYWLEVDLNPNVGGWLDAIYWAVATSTTVGYGDIVPVTVMGRVVSIVMMILGTFLFWSYTAIFASALLTPDLRKVEREVQEIEEQLSRAERSKESQKR